MGIRLHHTLVFRAEALTLRALVFRAEALTLRALVPKWPTVCRLETPDLDGSTCFLWFVPGSWIAGISGNSMQTKVLIVEDDNAMAQMCAKLIRRRGHTVVIAASGQDALAMVREARDIDVVISDVQMPKMSGMQLAASIHALNAKLPIILMTGYAQLLSPSEALEIGAADYILKPFEPETLIGSLERALNSVIRGQASHV